jgi:hypothetical protein
MEPEVPLTLPQIHRAVQALDHPEEERRLEARDLLMECPFDLRPALGQHLEQVSGRHRRRLVELIQRLDDERLIVPLMRFIHDSRTDLDEADSRGIAMRHLVDVAEPDHGRAAQMFAFASDMRHDPDRFVRALCMEMFARLNRSEAETFVLEGLSDRDEYVVEAALGAALCPALASLMPAIVARLAPGDRPINARAAKVLSHPAYLNMFDQVPGAAEALFPPLALLYKSGALDPAGELIPLLAIARRDHAESLLVELARGDDRLPSDRAKDILRLWRNQAPFIDVPFEPR